MLLCLASVGVSYASQGNEKTEQEVKVAKQREDKPLASRWSVMIGSAQFANHYISNQEYSGIISGVKMEFGRMYRRSENLSWELDLSYASASEGFMNSNLLNPAKTNGISATVFDISYATHYNWLLGNNWLLKVGGALNLYADANIQIANSMNNALSAQAATQLYASAGICYKAEFDKWDLKIYYNLSLPFAGMVFADTRYEGALGSMVEQSVSKRSENHFRATTLHNFQGVNSEVGLDFVTRKVTITLAYEDSNRWWTATDVQNYRKVSMIKLGFGVNLFQAQFDKHSTRYF